MKNLKQLKEVALKIKKKRKTQKTVNRAFAKLRANFDFIYYD